MRNITVAAGIICFFLLSSCATLYEFPVEVFQPAKVDLPASVKTVALASRNLKYQTDTLQLYYSRNSKLTKDIKLFNVDSVAVKTCFDSLMAKLDNQQRFEKVSMLSVTAFPKQFTKKMTRPTKSQVEMIASNSQTDAIIFLDMFSGFYSIYPVTDDNQNVAQVVTASIWTVYDPATYRILHHTSLIDTLYWDGLDEKGKYLAARIPAKIAAIEIAAGMAGTKYAKNLVPYWNQVKRQILACDKEEFPLALGLAKNNKWKEASAIWEKYTSAGNKRLRLQAMHNLAVAREMEGDIEGAQQLLTEALAIAPASSCEKEKKTIRNYSLILARRKIELEKINAMGYEE